MNSHYHLLGLLMAASLPVAANAQANATESNSDTTVSREIEIVKEYNPTIKEATKITTAPELKSDVTKKTNVNYSVWATPVVPNNDSVPPLDFALVGKSTKDFKREGYLKLGAGNYTSFMGETYIPLMQKKKDLIELYGSHNSSLGKVRLTHELYSDLETDNFRTKAKLNDNFLKGVYTHNIRAKELIAYADFGHTHFNYYGLDSHNLQGMQIDTVYDRDQAFTNFDAGLRFRTKKFVDRWSYDGQTNYQLFHTRDALNEHTIYTNINGSRLIDNGHVNLDFTMYNIFTSLPEDSFPFRFKDAKNTGSYTVLMFAPSYVVKAKRAEMNIGVKAAFGLGQGRSTSITPNLLGNISIVPDYWFLYAGITGDYTVNSYRNMAKINRYIALDNRAEDTYTPIDVYLGSKVNLFKYALLDLNVGYKVISNPYFFVADNCDTITKNNANGSFYNLQYGKDDGLFSAGAGLTTNYKDFVQLGVKGKVNKWALSKDEVAWMMPKTELQANLSVLPMKDLRVWMAYNHLGGRKACFGPYGNVRDMKNINDLSLGATYKAMSCVNVFLNLNNVLSNEYEQWYGYASQHFNFMAGVVVNF